MPAFPFRLRDLRQLQPQGADSRAVVRTQMEVGRAKTRRRSSMGGQPISAAYALEPNQVDDFEAWFADQIGHRRRDLRLDRPADSDAARRALFRR